LLHNLFFCPSHFLSRSSGFLSSSSSSSLPSSWRQDSAPASIPVDYDYSSSEGHNSNNLLPSDLKKCYQCNHLIEGGSRCHTTDDGKVHAGACYDVYRLTKAGVCGHCSKPVTSVGGEFSGKFFRTPAGIQIHEECK
jgi:hypothetical protein